MTQGRHPVLPALALSLGLLGCQVPFAGTSPTGAPVQPAATVTPTPAATPTPAPTPQAGVALRGTVFFNDTPVQNASLAAFDVASGRSLPLIAAGGQNLIAAGGQNLIAAGGQNLIAAGGQNLIGDAAGRYRVQQSGAPSTDVKGAFDCVLPPLQPGQVVRLRAVAGNQTYLALFDATGKAIGADEAPAAGYALKQAGTTTVRLKLTIGSTALANAFEGVIKLQLRLPPGEVAKALESVFAKVAVVAQQVEKALAAAPEKAAALLATVNANGDVGQLEAFRETLKAVGVFDAVYEAVKEELKAVAVAVSLDAKELDAIVAENFPLSLDVTITPDGAIEIKGQDGVVTTVAPAPSGGTPSGSTGGGSGGGGSGGGSGGSGGGGTVPVPTPVPTAPPVPVGPLLSSNLPGGLASISGRVVTLGASGPEGVAGAWVEVYTAVAPSTTVGSLGTATLTPPEFSTTILVGNTPEPVSKALLRTGPTGYYLLQGIAPGAYWIRAAAAEAGPFSNPRYLTFGVSGVGGVDLSVLRVTAPL